MTDNNNPKILPEILKRARNLRRNQTPAEKTLWLVLRNRQLGNYKFKRQQPIGKFIVDFYCHQLKLIIEIDGDTHSFQVDYDLNRTKWLEEKRFQVIRYTNQEVNLNLDGVVNSIIEICAHKHQE